jgi:prevent-host-death family protein
MTSENARRSFRQLFEAVIRGEHVTITRYGEDAAVIVPLDWYEQARAALKEGDRQ